MSNPHDLHRQIQLELGHGANRLFRNSVMVGWTGEVTRLKDGSVLITNPRPLHGGLGTGTSDLIGWHSVIVQPHHVGRPLAVFVALEAKLGKHARPTNEQKNFIAQVQAAGGLAGVVKAPNDARLLLESL
jgi:hypothetical protein